MVSIFSIFKLVLVIVSIDKSFSKSQHKNFTEIAESFGYPCQNHTVITEDGYILKVFRVQSKNTTVFSNSSRIIFIQHGLTDSSDSFIINYNPMNYDTVFLFADLGYDIWLGNSRGNYYSKAHVNLSTKSKEFWDFSFKEMGKYDIPAVFEYIGKFNPNKINYIGHSQGTTQFFYALTQKIPIIEDKLEHFFALAPPVYMGNMSSPVFDMAARNEYIIIKTLNFWGVHQVFKRNDLISSIRAEICQISDYICVQFMRLFNYKDPDYILRSQLPRFEQYEPSGASVKSFHHYAQLYVSNNFQDFDYGEKGNMEHYGQATPPIFPISNIKRKVYAFAGDNDELADQKDIARLKLEMGDYLNLTTIPNYGHSSFLFGITTDFTTKIREILESEPSSE